MHDLPPWMDDGAEWLRAIEALLRAERFDLVIPCNETALLPLQRNRERLAPLARLAIPDDHAIAVLFDKHATRELAQQVGVPVAAGRLVRPDDTAEAVAAEFGLPLVVKPRRSYALKTLARARQGAGGARCGDTGPHAARGGAGGDPAGAALPRAGPGRVAAGQPGPGAAGLRAPPRPRAGRGQLLSRLRAAFARPAARL